MNIEFHRSVVVEICSRCLSLGAVASIPVGHRFAVLTTPSGVTHRACLDCWGRLRAEVMKITLEPEQTALILGALDSLGVALAGHGHIWSDGERAIFEEARSILGQPHEEEGD